MRIKIDILIYLQVFEDVGKLRKIVPFVSAGFILIQKILLMPGCKKGNNEMYITIAESYISEYNGYKRINSYVFSNNVNYCESRIIPAKFQNFNKYSNFIFRNCSHSFKQCIKRNKDDQVNAYSNGKFSSCFYNYSYFPLIAKY